MKPIAHLRSALREKFGIPRQANMVPSLRSWIVFEAEFRQAECFRGLEDFSHLWLIWRFHLHGEKWQPTVRPPRLGGNQRMGVFATRSSFRPNGLGLSVVKIESINLNAKDGAYIEVSGADMVDATPIYDIKPYLPYADALPEATGGFASQHEWKEALPVCFAAGVDLPDAAWRQTAIELLSQDPRPAYQDDPERVYHLIIAPYELSFRVIDQAVEILRISPLEP